ncbi:MAG: hypothetical protein GX129_09040 [Clostridiales bacterium]|jgi:hypothetical protein|nr:hypothetical protein [Clostridiales bacterium]
MANFFGLNFKSKEEREKEYQEYFYKIFPYGEPQKQRVEELLINLLNKNKGNQFMMHYILIKEAMIDSEVKDYEAIAVDVEKKRFVKLTPELKDCVRILIYKDLAMDEGLEYPTVQELKAMAEKKY